MSDSRKRQRVARMPHYMISSVEMHRRLLAALDSPEDGIERPVLRDREPSMTLLIECLEIGHTFARAYAIDGRTSLANLDGQVAEQARLARNVMNPMVRRAGNTTGNTYVVEVLNGMSSNGSLFVVIVVTRTK